MHTIISLIFIVALFLNTTLLLAEPLFGLVRGVHPLFFVALEAVPIIIYWVNRFLGNFSKAVEINFGNLEIFYYKKRK